MKSNSDFTDKEELPLRVFKGRAWYEVAFNKVAWACEYCGREVNAQENHWSIEDLKRECRARLREEIKTRGVFRFYMKRMNDLINSKKLAYKLRGEPFDTAVEKAIEKIYEEAEMWGY